MSEEEDYRIVDYKVNDNKYAEKVPVEEAVADPNSMQSKINENGVINHEVLNDYLVYMELNNWKELENLEDIKTLQLTTYIRYIRKTNGKEKYVSGGFILVFSDEFLVFRTGRILWSLQYKDIVKLWYNTDTNLVDSNGKVKKKKTKVKTPKVKLVREPERKIVTYKKPDKKGNYEAFIGEICVYRTDNKTKFDNFLNTDKYARAVETDNFVVKS